MKKLIYAFLAMGMIGCTAESIDSEEFLTADAKFKITVAESFNVPELICAGEEATLSLTAAVGTNLQVQEYNPELNDWVQIFQTSKSVVETETFKRTWDMPGTYELRYKIGNGGFTDISILVEDCSDCDESFTYEDNEDGSYTFTYIPEEYMKDAHLVFTLAQSDTDTGLEGWEDKGATKQMIMDLEACQAYSWTVTLTPNCSGNSSSSNAWTDFKVNDVSKKGDLENIVKSCN